MVAFSQSKAKCFVSSQINLDVQNSLSNILEVWAKRDIVSNVVMILSAKSVNRRGWAKNLKYMDDPQLKQLSGNNLQSIARQ